jgi:hypothetical protein
MSVASYNKTILYDNVARTVRRPPAPDPFPYRLGRPSHKIVAGSRKGYGFVARQ